jgi:hypothetical protein
VLLDEFFTDPRFHLTQSGVLRELYVFQVVDEGTRLDTGKLEIAACIALRI